MAGPPGTGFHLYHGNRLEGLVQALAAVLRVDPPATLGGEVVLVPHPGMAQWLKMRLADTLGIAAGFEFPLPATWFGRLAGSGHDAADSLAWSRDALTWRLYELSPSVPGPLGHVLAVDDRSALARWQLAVRIASMFERYQLQRPDWLQAWGNGRRVLSGVDGEIWQQSLWQLLLSTAPTARREALAQRLRPGAAHVDDLPRRLFVFGFASLPTLYLDGLRTLSERVQVHLYFANPCRWYWGELRSEREQLGRDRRLGYRNEQAADDEGHPLLAGFGAVARDFLRQLYAGDAAYDSEHELFQHGEGDSVLASLQNAILDYQSSASLTWREGDRSLRLLRAPNRRRELEGLHDLLLDLFESDPGLRPNEIAVLVPKLADYATLAEAVFGGQPSERRIPYQITDLSEAERHPLPALLLHLLDLPVWRFGLGEVLDALARPAFAAAFDIPVAELPRLASLLEQAGARWGLDARFREGLAAGDSGSHSFRFAIDRLLAGWLSGDDAAIADGIAPQAALRGQDAELIGRFLVCLDALDQWRHRLAQPRSLTEWSRVLSELRGRFFADSSDADENAALLRLAGSLQSWRERSAGHDQMPVPRRVLRAALAESLHSTAVSALPGEGVNLCAMVPLRGLPFRVVVLLGLAEGEFPRRDTELPDDLCRVRPRPGDRSIRAEDRYLFLEALTSARDCLVLSHVDRDPESGQPRPPSPVLAELIDHLARSAFAGDATKVAARTETIAILPGDPRHFGVGDADGFVPSHGAEWLAPAPQLPPVRGLDTEPPESWQALCALFLDPARTQLRWRGVDLGSDDEPVADSEPFQLDGLQGYQLREELLAGLTRDPELPFERARAQACALGLLPPGHGGEQALELAWRDVGTIHDLHRAAAQGRDLGVFEGRILVAGQDWSLRLDDVDDQGLLRRTVGRINGKRMLGAWLDLLALRLAGAGPNLRAILIDREGRVELSGPADPETALGSLLELWQQARAAPLPLYPRSSFGYVEALVLKGQTEDKAMSVAHTLWHGNAFNQLPGECEQPACAELARSLGRWDAAGFTTLARAVYGPVLTAVES